MATLYEALQCLQPTSWDAVPQSPEELRVYVRDIFKKSRLVAESVPNPPPYEQDEYPGTDFGTHVVPSSTRVDESDPEIIAMQKLWGKPIKMGGQKDNPLGVHVWKLSAGDGKGQWFGRRSVHEGISFARWREKLSTEIEETLKVNRKKLEKGETANNSIRGIGAEERVEVVEITDEDGSELGQMTLYHLSAQFPKPTSPRDFVTLIITSDVGLQVGGTKQPGRSWMMVSKPCDHPDVSEKPGYIRGEYESVELFREIAVRKSGQGISHGPVIADGQYPAEVDETDGALEDEDDEMNPVEWIMVTRSDPGGSIPRWMVDKGTPKSVGTDAAKFVKWAVGDDMSQQGVQLTQAGSVQGSKPRESVDQRSDDDNESSSESDSTDTDFYDAPPGLIASVTGLINTGLERFAPQAVLDYIPHHQEHPHHLPGDIQVPQNPADSSRSSNTTGHHRSEPDRFSLSSVPSEMQAPGIGEVTHRNVFEQEAAQPNTKPSKITQYEKELAKLAIRKQEVEAKLDSVRTERDNVHLPAQINNTSSTPNKGVNDTESDTSSMINKAARNRSSTSGSSSTRQSQHNDEKNKSDNNSHAPPASSDTPTPTDTAAHIQKAALRLSNEETKLLKQLHKIEASQEKITSKIEGTQAKLASKIEARQRKQAAREEKTRSRSEVEGLRREVQDLKKEVASLRAERQKWVDLVTSLQAENTRLVAEKEGGSGVS